MNDPRPTFRFFPTCYEAGKLVPSQEVCEACGRLCVWQVAWPTPLVICARCLADGTLSPREGDLPRSMQSNEPYALPEPYAAEIESRTPRVDCFNDYDWPLHEGIPMAFLGHGEDPALWEDPLLREAMRTAWNALGWDEELTGPTSWLMVFRSLCGTAARAVVDMG